MTTKARTIKQVNDYLSSNGAEEKLARGEGYYYFYEGSTDSWSITCVPVPYVSSLTPEQWFEELEYLKQYNKI